MTEKEKYIADNFAKGVVKDNDRKGVHTLRT